MRLLVVVVVLLVTSRAFAVDVLTSRYSPARTGVNTQETVLTSANIGPQSFGKLWSLYADGQIVAQPLYVSGLAVDTSSNPQTPPVTGTYNALLVATMHNTVYLYDADRPAPGPDGRTVPLWATWLGQPRPSGKDIDMWSTNDPEWGILSTPVISADKLIVYVVAWHDDGGQKYRYRLHALRMKDGNHAAPPVELQAPGLDSSHQKQRVGLALANGALYIGFGGDGSRGLLLAHDAATLAQRAAWNVAPTGNDGGLWQAGVAPAIDGDGNVYLMTGNGTFDAQSGGPNYGDSFVKLRLEGDKIVVKDFFTPCNETFLKERDMDLGSSGPVLVPGQNIVLGAGKDGHLFLLATDRLGKHTAPPREGAETCPNPTALQDFFKIARGHVHGAPVYWEGPNGAYLYVWGENDQLRAYRFVNRRLAANPALSAFAPPHGMPGGMLAVSSNDRASGVVWAVVPLNGDANEYRGVKGVVLALNAQDVTKALWTSEQSGDRDRLGLFAKYVPPTVANGRVYIATYGDEEPLRRYAGDARPGQFPRYQVVVYGMLPKTERPIVNQNRDDVQIVRATVEALPRLNTARCHQQPGETLDCTDELARIAGVPSIERIAVPAGYTFDGCQLARVTAAARKTALPASLAIGFYSADVTAGQFSADRGRRITSAQLTSAGDAVLKSGEPAALFQFGAMVNCRLGGGATAGLRFKPYIDFVGDPDNTTYRNWDPVRDDYRLGGDVQGIDRTQEVLR